MEDSKIVKCYKIQTNDFNQSFYPSALEDLVLTYITLYCNKVKEVTPNNAFWVNTKFYREDLVKYIRNKTGKNLTNHRLSKIFDSLKAKDFLINPSRSVYKNNGNKFYILKS